MDETIEQPKKPGWPKGKKRGPRKASVAAPMFAAAPEPPAPINVRILLKNGFESEFGCSRRAVENGFHVFFYPSETDRYRETQRWFAISEIVELEITEARQTYNFVLPEQPEVVKTYNREPPLTVAAGPKIHSARQNANNIISQLEQSSGSIKMDKMPNLSFGDSEA